MKDPFAASRPYSDFGGDALPLDLQLDLLVDAELPEDRRRALLLSLDRDPSGSGWRNLSMRFLERQTERQGVRDLIAGGRLMSIDEPLSFQAAQRRWLRWPAISSIAAGFIIATGSALLTGYWLQHQPATTPAAPKNVEVASSKLPGSALGTREVTPAVEYTVVSERPFTDATLQLAPGDTPSQRRSLVIQPDGPGKAVIIPVSKLPIEVY